MTHIIFRVLYLPIPNKIFQLLDNFLGLDFFSGLEKFLLLKIF